MKRVTLILNWVAVTMIVISNVMRYLPDYYHVDKSGDKTYLTPEIDIPELVLSSLAIALLMMNIAALRKK